jgi:hypothetical protein
VIENVIGSRNRIDVGDEAGMEIWSSEDVLVAGRSSRHLHLVENRRIHLFWVEGCGIDQGERREQGEVRCVVQGLYQHELVAETGKRLCAEGQC